jgi:hypothetical protein
MTPQEAIEAFARGLTRGLMEANAPAAPVVRSQRRPARRRGKATRAAAPPSPPTLSFDDFLRASAVNSGTVNEPIFDDKAPPGPTLDEAAYANDDLTPGERERIAAVLAGEVPRGMYNPDETEGDQPWKA